MSLKNKKGVVVVPLLIAAFGLLLFFAFTLLAPFKDQLWQTLFPKPKSEAAEVVLSDAEVIDYLVQNVCAGGTLVASDPYLCPAGTSPRDLAAGEKLTYSKRDQTGGQDSNSFPIYDSNSGTVRYVTTFDFAGAGNLAFQQYDNGTDGYDIIERTGLFVSIPATRDPTGDTFFYTHGCILEDGWFLFPNNIYNGAENLNALAWIAGTHTESCPGDYVVALNQYRLPTSSFTYTNGKAMGTITTSHYDKDTVSASVHMEKMFFTKQYGKTRWESWDRNGVPNGMGCNGSNADDTGFVRTACREWTNIITLPGDGYQPLVWQVKTTVANGNLPDDADFGRGPADIGSWQRWSNTNWALQQDVSTKNTYLATNCMSKPCKGASVFQDIPRSTIPSDATMSFGGSFWVGASSSVGHLYVHQLRADGTVSTSSVLTVNVTSLRQTVKTSFAVAADAATFRLQFYPGVYGVTYYLDDFLLIRN